MTCACLYQGPSYLPVMVLPTCTPFGVALPSWASPLGLAWFLWVFAPLVSFFCGVGWFFAGLFAPKWCGLGALAEATESFVPVGPLPSVLPKACFRWCFLPWRHDFYHGIGEVARDTWCKVGAIMVEMSL